MRIGLLIGAAAALCLLTIASAQTPSQGAPGAGPVPTTFIVRFKIKPGRNTDFEQAMAKMQAALASSEPGNVFYDLYLPAPGTQTYVLIEHYRDAAAVTAHGKDPITKQMVADIGDLLDGPMAQAISAERLVLVSSKP
jgi:quinol monooxygenase YgiN